MRAGLMLGVNNKAEREKYDFYATDPYAIDVALETFRKIGLNNKVWECSCGKGHLSERLKSFGYTVFSSDLIDRKYGKQLDFLKTERNIGQGDIITNPPFSLAEDFVAHSMKILQEGQRAFFFLKIQFLETKGRKELFSKYPPEYVIINSERICCAKDGEFEKYFKKKGNRYTGGTQFYAWFVFKKNYKGDTKVLWI